MIGPSIIDTNDLEVRIGSYQKWFLLKFFFITLAKTSSKDRALKELITECSKWDQVNLCVNIVRAEYIAEEDPNSDINLAKSSELPEPETMDNVEPLISHHHVDATDPYSKKKKGILLKDGMAELARRGTLRVTSYRDSSEGVEGAD